MLCVNINIFCALLPTQLQFQMRFQLLKLPFERSVKEEIENYPHIACAQCMVLTNEYGADGSITKRNYRVIAKEFFSVLE